MIETIVHVDILLLSDNPKLTPWRGLPKKKRQPVRTFAGASHSPGNDVLFARRLDHYGLLFASLGMADDDAPEKRSVLMRFMPFSPHVTLLQELADFKHWSPPPKASYDGVAICPALSPAPGT